MGVSRQPPSVAKVEDAADAGVKGEAVVVYADPLTRLPSSSAEASALSRRRKSCTADRRDKRIYSGQERCYENYQGRGHARG